MDIFGSREEDPLLQGDPFAPADDKSHDPSSADPSKEASQSTQAAEGESALESVFESDAATERGAEEAVRVVVRSADAAAEGQLADVNAAFEQGWRLARVDLRSESGDDLKESAALSIAFFLQNSESEG